jgi:hypothetical protein
MNQPLYGEIARQLHTMIARSYNTAAGCKLHSAAVIAYASAGEFARFNPVQFLHSRNCQGVCQRQTPSPARHRAGGRLRSFRVEDHTATVPYHTPYNPFFRTDRKIFRATDFIAQLLCGTCLTLASGSSAATGCTPPAPGVLGCASPTWYASPPSDGSSIMRCKTPFA